MTAEQEVYWLTCTVWMEAQGEPFEGQLAVAHVIMNRKGSGSIIDTILRKLQFSAWNTDSAVRLRLDDAENDEMWTPCYKASCAAYFDLLPDPTNGATHYLNPDKLPSLPSWYNKNLVVATFGGHEFLKI